MHAQRAGRARDLEPDNATGGGVDVQPEALELRRGRLRGRGHSQRANTNGAETKSEYGAAEISAKR